MSPRRTRRQDKKAEKDFYEKRASGVQSATVLEIPSLQPANVLKNCKLDRQSLVLDARCGTGGYGKEIIKQGGYVVGVDIKHRNAKDSKGENVRTAFLGDMESLPFKDEGFDNVLCSYVLHHFPSFLFASDECKRVLKVNGKLVVFEVNLTFAEKLSRIVGKILSKRLKEVATPNETLHNIKDYIAILLERGFTSFSVTPFFNAPTPGEAVSYSLRNHNVLFPLILIRAILRRIVFLMLPKKKGCNSIIITAIKRVCENNHLVDRLIADHL